MFLMNSLFIFSGSICRPVLFWFICNRFNFLLTFFLLHYFSYFSSGIQITPLWILFVSFTYASLFLWFFIILNFHSIFPVSFLFSILFIHLIWWKWRFFSWNAYLQKFYIGKCLDHKQIFSYYPRVVYTNEFLWWFLPSYPLRYGIAQNSISLIPTSFSNKLLLSTVASMFYCWNSFWFLLDINSSMWTSPNIGFISQIHHFLRQYMLKDLNNFLLL